MIYDPFDDEFMDEDEKQLKALMGAILRAKTKDRETDKDAG